ncbi:hypothetical protein TNCV_2031671 [Trichonephila clavipes]|nr:hypothetical protein TNCV_2031671 [Trichonephila clavipes]
MAAMRRACVRIPEKTWRVVASVTTLGNRGHGLGASVTEDPPYGESRCTYYLFRLICPLFGVVRKVPANQDSK